MEIRVSSSEEVPKKCRLAEHFSHVRKPCGKVEEIYDMVDFDSYRFGVKKDELCEAEDAEVTKSIVKAICIDDKEQLLIQVNRLMQKRYKHGESVEDNLDEDREECCGLVSKLLQSCCLLDSEKCATALLSGEVMGLTPFVNEMNESGLSPLHTAATVHSVKCIELLLRRNARTDIRSNDVRSQIALELSLSSRRMEVVWKVGDPIEDLLVCLNQKNLAAVRLLAEKTKEIGQVAYSVAFNGQVVSLAALLMVASEKVLLPMAGVQSNGDLGNKEMITIYDCLMSEAFTCTNDSAENVSMRRKQLLCEMELCQLFGAEPQRSLGEKKSASPLISAIQAADLEVVKLLLETGVKISETDDQGNSALHWALKMNSALCLKQMKIIGLLLQHGARVTQKNKLGLTPLHIAASNGNFQAIQILLSEEPNSVHTTTEMKETPLFFAVKNDHKECVELLLRSGANSEVLNIRKQRPVDFAKSQDIRFILNPTNIRLWYHTPKNMQKFSVDAKAALRGFGSTLYATGNANFIPESLKSIEPCKYFKSSHGCVRGAKCFFLHGEEHALSKSGRHLSCLRASDLRRKIFVGGLPASIDSDSLGKYFEHFGSVEDAIVVETQNCDQSHSRGFGFVTFKCEKSVIVAVQAQYILIMGKKVEIKSFLPRSPPSEPGNVEVHHEIEQEYVGLDLQTPCMEVKNTDEDNLSKKSWVDKLFHNSHENSPLGLQAQASHSIVKSKEPEWLRVFRKWFPSFMTKKLKCLGKGESYALSSLKGDFRAICGFELDHSSIGYAKLSHFLAATTDICHVKYVPEKGKGSPTHMVLVPNLSRPKKKPAEPVKSPNSRSGSSCSSTDGHLEDSKLIQDAVTLPADEKVSENCSCQLVQDYPTDSFSPSLDCKIFDDVDDLIRSYKDESGDSDSFTLLAHLVAPGALSSEEKIRNLSTDFLFQCDQPGTPIWSDSTSVMKVPLHGDYMGSTEENTFVTTSFLQFLSPDPLFHGRPWVKNESCRSSKPTEFESHPVLEDFSRRNSSSIFFLREFDFYMKYYKCLQEEECFSCCKQRMSWANYPCRHLLWCDDCRNHVVEAAKGSDHKCVICDSKVQKLLHNFNSTSWSKVIQPHCLPILDDTAFPSICPPIFGSPSSSRVENVS